MNVHRRRIALPLAIICTLAATPALTGCVANPIESIVEGATGTDIDPGGASIPDGFPAEVPLFSGQVVNGAALGSAEARVFNLTIAVPDASAIESIRSQLEGAGFTSQDDLADTIDSSAYVGQTDRWGVIVVVSKDGDRGFLANYTVTAASPR